MLAATMNSSCTLCRQTTSSANRACRYDFTLSAFPVVQAAAWTTSARGAYDICCAWSPDNGSDQRRSARKLPIRDHDAQNRRPPFPVLSASHRDPCSPSAAASRQPSRAMRDSSPSEPSSPPGSRLPRGSRPPRLRPGPPVRLPRSPATRWRCSEPPEVLGSTLHFVVACHRRAHPRRRPSSLFTPSMPTAHPVPPYSCFVFPPQAACPPAQNEPDD